MATAGGPDIERNGLVFGYDTSYGIDTNNISSRFYQGEPATNLFTVLGTPSNTDQNVTFAVQGTGVFKRVAVGTKIGNYTVRAEDVVYSYALGGTGCHYHGNDYGTISSGTKVSLNLEYFLSSDVSIVTNYLGNFEQLSGVAGSWGSVNPETNKWHRVSLTRTATGTGNLRMLMYPGACSSSTLSNQGTIYFKNPTVTLTAQPTTFVNGTRSSTQSLIDLTKSTTIDVSNVSFNSTGQPTFDGTDDYIDLGSDITFKATGGWTVESVVKYNSVAGGYNNLTSPANFIGAGSISYNSWYWSVLNSKLALWNISPGVWKYGSTTLQADTWYHAVLVSYDSGTSYQMYLNGVAEGGDHTTYSWNSSYAGLKVRYIGAGQTTRRYVNGDIPVVKIYDRALSADEVQQNFKAYKNRFNI